MATSVSSIALEVTAASSVAWVATWASVALVATWAFVALVATSISSVALVATAVSEFRSLSMIKTGVEVVAFIA